MIYYTVRPSGVGAWYPRAYTNEEALEAQVKEFTEKYQALNPPPTPGTFKLTLKNVIDVMDSNRWPCIGGPMDGEGIAKEIALNKGAGGTISGYYAFDGNQYNWVSFIKEKIIEPDPWINQEEKEAFENG